MRVPPGPENVAAPSPILGPGSRYAVVIGISRYEASKLTLKHARHDAEAVYAFLAWDRGQFKFVPGDPGAGAPLAQSLEHLLLEGCRLLDESRGAAR